MGSQSNERTSPLTGNEGGMTSGAVQRSALDTDGALGLSIQQYNGYTIPAEVYTQSVHEWGEAYTQNVESSQSPLSVHSVGASNTTQQHTPQNYYDNEALTQWSLQQAVASTTNTENPQYTHLQAQYSHLPATQLYSQDPSGSTANLSTTQAGYEYPGNQLQTMVAQSGSFYGNQSYNSLAASMLGQKPDASKGIELKILHTINFPSTIQIF